MKLEYNNKKKKIDILNPINKKFRKTISVKNINKELNQYLFQGDNLEIMKILLDEYDMRSSVDLIYIDPPFATNNTFRINNDRVSTISHSKDDNIAYEDKLTGAEYLEFIRERLILLREFLSDKGSIYFHIDYKIGHYVKVIMDEVFGINNFRNDITRVKSNPKNFKRKSYGNQKDLILFYTKTDNYIWNDAVEERTGKELEKLFNKVDEKGRIYTTNPLHAPGETISGQSGKEWNGLKPPKGRHWRCSQDVLDKLQKDGLIHWSKNGVPRKIIYMDDFSTKKVQDIWDFKDKQKPLYPTEKNIDLLKRIIKASSNPGSLVFDCFCGSGSFLKSADELDRRWMGVDQSLEAIKVTKCRFKGEKINLIKFK